MSDYHIETEWNYNRTYNQNRNWFGSKIEWIQTILTKINECSTRLHMASPNVKMESITIKSHISLKFLFMPIKYYNHSAQRIGSKYKIEYVTDIEEDSIEMSFNNKTAKVKVIT